MENNTKDEVTTKQVVNLILIGIILIFSLLPFLFTVDVIFGIGSIASILAPSFYILLMMVGTFSFVNEEIFIKFFIAFMIIIYIPVTLVLLINTPRFRRVDFFDYLLEYVMFIGYAITIVSIIILVYINHEKILKTIDCQ